MVNCTISLLESNLINVMVALKQVYLIPVKQHHAWAWDFIRQYVYIHLIHENGYIVYVSLHSKLANTHHHLT